MMKFEFIPERDEVFGNGVTYFLRQSLEGSQSKLEINIGSHSVASVVTHRGILCVALNLDKLAICAALYK